MLGLGGGYGQHLAVTLLQTVFELRVTDDQHVLLVSRHQTNLKIQDMIRKYSDTFLIWL